VRLTRSEPIMMTLEKKKKKTPFPGSVSFLGSGKLVGRRSSPNPLNALSYALSPTLGIFVTWSFNRVLMSSPFGGSKSQERE